MNKKRGFLLVVIILIVISTFVSAREDYSVIEDTHYALGSSIELPNGYLPSPTPIVAAISNAIPFCTSGYGTDCWECRASGGWTCLVTSGQCRGENTFNVGGIPGSARRIGIYLNELDKHDIDECSEEKTIEKIDTLDKQCAIYVRDRDDGGCDVAGAGFGVAIAPINAGGIVEQQDDGEEFSLRSINIGLNPEGEDPKVEVMCGHGRMRMNSARYRIPIEKDEDTATTYLCGDDTQWNKCEVTENEDGDTKVITEGYAWGGENLYNCTVDEDDYSLWDNLGPDTDHDFYIDETEGDCKYDPSLDQPFCSEVETPEMCEEDLKYYQCAKCINPGAPEVCGDNVDNDCSSATSDDCNKNKESCEQSENILTFPDGTEITSVIHKNIYDEKFSWVETGNNEGFCCGFNGIEGLGEILTDRQGVGYVCLNKNPSSRLTGWGGNFPEEHCPNSLNWCLVNAATIPPEGGKWNIFTVSKPNKIYDVASNGNKWFECTEEGQTLSAEDAAESESQKFANRYYCYKEGDKLSWAECYGDTASKNNDNIKGRFKGDAPYSLIISGADELTGAKYGESIVVNRDGYIEFYGDNSYFDFTGYDYLEFFVKYVSDDIGTAMTPEDSNFKLPANILLEMFGPEKADQIKTILFNESILGYVQTGPFFSEDGWMHVKVPISEKLKGIKSLRLTSYPNLIGVKNIFLTNSIADTKFCSGEDSLLDSSWLENLDQGTESSSISGKELCTEHYGENAWLGYDGEVGENWASCCGNGNNNNQAEFYFGESTVNENGDSYGCWNSQSIKSGETIMNVMFNVQYTQQKREFRYPESNIPVKIKKRCTKSEIDDSSEVLIYLPLNINQIALDSPTIYEGNLDFSCPTNKSLFQAEIEPINDPLIDVEFYDPRSGAHLSESIYGFSFNDYEQDQIKLIATSKKINEISSEEEEINLPVVYSCLGEECLYPVPGNPPYIISNPNPELYELYFVTGSEPEDEELIEGNFETEEAGNIKARSIAQQVLYVNDDQESGFYGCQAADFIDQIDEENNLPYCSTKSEYFCAPSVTHEKEGREKYSTISSWSKDGITQVGYEDLQGIEDQNISDFYQQTTLQLKEAAYTAGQRNQSAVILPARNMISNAEFTTEGKQIPHWQFFIRNVPVEEEKEYYNRATERIELTGEVKMRSEKISIVNDAQISLTYNGTAEVKIFLIDKNGIIEETYFERGEFSTESASFIVLEFTSGDISQPMLQMVDEYGTTNYYYNNNELPRTGLACCPTNFCWNGYACVEPMGEASSLAEHVEEGRDYRCIDGTWRNVPVRWDWNHQKPGFCSTTNQCFVLSSEFQASEENTANQFYENKVPVCVEDKEYIFDHYCSEGIWTSRTKFLASKLADVANNDDYKLYCTDYRGALIDYSLTEDYLGGSLTRETSDTPDLGEELDEENVNREIVQTCYELTGEAQRLVPEKENTCVNNICILEIDGKKVAFATTVNEPLEDTNSFLNIFGLPHQSITNNEVCSGEEGKYSQCDVDMEGDLWYSEDIEGLIYTKDNIALTSAWRNVQDWFLGLFGAESSLSDEERFIADAKNFRDIFILDQNGKKIRAVKEVLSEDKQTLIAEYENFNTPVCDYLNAYKDAPPTAELGRELLEQLSSAGNVVCEDDENVQKIETVVALDFLWPQLTSKIRVEE
jgi:hypothetical protein